MFLHLGQNVVVKEADIIGIFDIDNTTSSHITKKYLNIASQAGRVINVSEELPRSFILSGSNCCIGDDKKNNFYIHISQLSPQTLQKRSETMRFE